MRLASARTSLWTAVQGVIVCDTLSTTPRTRVSTERWKSTSLCLMCSIHSRSDARLRYLTSASSGSSRIGRLIPSVASTVTRRSHQPRSVVDSCLPGQRPGEDALDPALRFREPLAAALDDVAHRGKRQE